MMGLKVKDWILFLICGLMAWAAYSSPVRSAVSCKHMMLVEPQEEEEWINENASIRSLWSGANMPYWTIPVPFDPMQQTLELKFRSIGYDEHSHPDWFLNRVLYANSDSGQMFWLHHRALAKFSIWKLGGNAIDFQYSYGSILVIRIGPDGIYANDEMLTDDIGIFPNTYTGAYGTFLMCQNGMYGSSGYIYHLTVSNPDGGFAFAAYARDMNGDACLYDVVSKTKWTPRVGNGGSTADVEYVVDED